MGSIRGWLEVNTKGKWLRWNPYQEWFDLWIVKESRDELAAFFDRYLRGLDSGWEKSAKVRMSVLRFGDNNPYHYFTEDDYPVPRTKYTDFYLHPGASLGLSPQEAGRTISFNSEYHGEPQYDLAAFKLTFEKTTRLVGLPKAIVYMSCPDHDDMTVHLMIRDLDRQGNAMLNLNIDWAYALVRSMAEVDHKAQSDILFYNGALGVLRAARRHIDPSRSFHPQIPFHTHDREEKL